MIGVHTYTEAPPIPDFISSTKEKVITKEDVLNGQAIFQRYALMEYGSMFGDGANRGPDYTAEALHKVSLYMTDYYRLQLQQEINHELIEQGISEQVKKEIKDNNYIKEGNSVVLSPAQVYAANMLANFYAAKFTDPSFPGAFKPAGYINDRAELRSLSAFFFWGAWVCGVQRPGEKYS